MGKKYNRTKSGRRSEDHPTYLHAQERANQMKSHVDKSNIHINETSDGYKVSYTSSNDRGSKDGSKDGTNVSREYDGRDDAHTYGYPDEFWD